MKHRLCGEVEGKHWARVRGAFDGCSMATNALWPKKRVSPLQILVSHLYSKDLKREHSKIFTKGALTVKESENVEVWEHSITSN